nr:hypothetical protein [uncultured Hyphomonas sp.]
MDPNQQFEQRLERENFLEAKKKIGEREAHFEGATKLAIQYCSIANAAAIATLIGFVATVGKDIGNPQIFLLSFVLFLIGIVCAGAALRLHLLLQEKNLQEAISSFLISANNKNIGLFNDVHKDSPRYTMGVRRWLSAAFVFFVVGLSAAGAAFPFVEWHTDDSSEENSASTEEQAESKGGNFLRESEKDVAAPKPKEPIEPE